MPNSSSKLIFLAVLALALAVRAVNLGGQSLNMDEVNEVVQAHYSATEIISAADSMPPLYSLLLKAWLAVWGTDEAARWLSVLFGVAAVGCVWPITARLAGDDAAPWAALVLALLPLHVFYSQFVRSYAMLFFCVALALWLLLRAADRDRTRDWAAFVAACVVGCYTHYYFAIFLVVSVVVLLLTRRSWWIGRRALAAYAVAGVLSLPLLWLLPGDLHFQTGLRDPRTLGVASFGYTYLSMFTGYSLGPSRPELQTLSPVAAASAAAPWAAAIGLVLLILGYEGLRRLWERHTLAITLAVLLLPVLLVGGLGYAGGLNYHVRFVLWSMIAVAVWLGAGVARGWSRWWVKVAVVLYVVLAGLALYQRHAVPRYQNEDIRGAAAAIVVETELPQTVFIASDYLALPLRYYLGDEWQVIELPTAGEINHMIVTPEQVDEATATIATHAAANGPQWLVYSRAFHGDPQGLLIKQLTERDGWSLEEELSGVKLYQHTSDSNSD